MTNIGFIKNRLLQDRYAICLFFILAYSLFSFLLRCYFFILSIPYIKLSFSDILRVFFRGFLFDFGTSIFFILPYAAYILVFPKKLIGSTWDKFFTYFILFITLVITFFAFFGEVPFWEEFNTRYNFIAVDYLIYTYEVVENINQSYPIPLLTIILLLFCAFIFFILKKSKLLKKSFSGKISFKYRLVYFLPLLLISFLYIRFVENKDAEDSNNTYLNELSKNGVYSFFAAFRSNELDFNVFYPNIPLNQAFDIIRNELKQTNSTYLTNKITDIRRQVVNGSKKESTPNIVLICIESFDAGFMKTFGNEQNLTPNIDKLAVESILYANMFSTGTRTIRGLEAITLSVPPTPGNSIVRRPNNDSLVSISTILKEKNYKLNFFYGGDGYFDNMNNFFAGQGFNIIDRNRGNPLNDEINTSRINIEDNEVRFENAWGISDQDIYNKVIHLTDKNYKNKQPTFNFIMTTSNHRPYTFPENTIDLPQGSREAAVKYTDFAIGDFFEKARKKPWFQNTVFIIIADHCASSAGRWEINIGKHHIPAMVYNLPNQKPEKINKLVSQIDIMPSVFGLLKWNYTTALYGKDIAKMEKTEERALIGNYRTVGLLKESIFTEINDRKKTKQYMWSGGSDMTELKKMHKHLQDLTISYYQTASYRFKNGFMKN